MDVLGSILLKYYKAYIIHLPTTRIASGYPIQLSLIRLLWMSGDAFSDFWIDMITGLPSR